MEYNCVQTRRILSDPKLFIPQEELDIIYRSFSCSSYCIETMKQILSDPRVPINQGIFYQVCRSRHSDIIVKLLFEDKRINPEGKDYFECLFYHVGYGGFLGYGFCGGEKYINNPDVVIKLTIDSKEYICLFDKNPKRFCVLYPQTAYEHEQLEEAYLRWMYRIGGEKYLEACESLKNK